MSQLLAQMREAETDKAMVAAKCRQARIDAVGTYQIQMEKYDALSTLRHRAKEMEQDLALDFAAELETAEAVFKEACQNARDAHTMRRVLEQAYQKAHNDEASARLLYDQYLESQHASTSTHIRPDLDDSTPIRRWRQEVEVAFADYSTMTTFPSSPANGTTHHSISCQAQRLHASRSLTACDCAILHAFQSLDDVNLRHKRLRWHPDRFVVCAKEVRLEFQRKAQEVYDVLEMLYQQTLRARM